MEWSMSSASFSSSSSSTSSVSNKMFKIKRRCSELNAASNKLCSNRPAADTTTTTHLSNNNYLSSKRTAFKRLEFNRDLSESPRCYTDTTTAITTTTTNVTSGGNDSFTLTCPNLSCHGGDSENSEAAKQQHQQHEMDTSADLFDSMMIIEQAATANAATLARMTSVELSPVFYKNSATAKSSHSLRIRTLKCKSKSFGHQASGGVHALHQRLLMNGENNNENTFNEEAIKRALHVSTCDLLDRYIGDMSRKHTLPILAKSKHSDLASITPQTMADLVSGKFKNEIGKFLVFDARYPYEYHGGHIRDAVNVYDKESLFAKLFDEPLTTGVGHERKPVVLIFHCEFSSERGPRLMREIREKDRLLNEDKYPHLYYPEMYLLEGGYKDFFQNHDSLCDPRSYLPMLHDSHRDDLKYFRKKSKTWEVNSLVVK